MTKTKTKMTTTTTEAAKAKTTNTTTPAYFKKRLEGITTNAVLLDLWKDAYAYSIKVVGAAAATNANANADDAKVEVEVDIASSGIAAPKTEAEATEVLRKAGDPSSKIKNNENKNKSSSIVMPIRVLQAIRIVLLLLLSPAKIESLDCALDETTSSMPSSSSTSSSSLLVFTPPPPEPEMTIERKRYLYRMGKLRLQNEETKYTKITNNIKDQRQEDDTTTKSMTFAASVGINMIVAPISFGAFMYFFSGGVFDFFWPPPTEGEYDDFNNNRNNRNPTGVDIKRVIIAVISGVAMMIIEMVLFVIRTHEFETHTAKKKKKRGVEPFGAYSANSAMTYSDDNPNIKNNNNKQASSKKGGEEQLAAKKKK